MHAFVFYYPAGAEWHSDIAEMLCCFKLEQEKMQMPGTGGFEVYSIVIVPDDDKKYIPKYRKITDNPHICYTVAENMNESVMRLILQITE